MTWAARSVNWRWTSISSITPTPKSKCLRRLARVLRVIAAPLRPLLGRLPSRDVQGFRASDILQPLLLKP